MPWTATRARLQATVDRARSRRRAHRALARELADYATPAERDQLAALIAGRGHGDGEVAELPARQSRLGTLRDSNPPFWLFPPAP